MNYNTMTNEEKNKAVHEWLKVQEHNEQVAKLQMKSNLTWMTVISVITGLVAYFGLEFTVVQSIFSAIGMFIFLGCNAADR